MPQEHLEVIRLQASGYYGPDGKPVISYKETQYRPFGKRRRSHKRHNSRAKKVAYTKSFRDTRVFKMLVFLLCILLLCFGLTESISLDSNPSTPRVPANNKVFNTPREDVVQQMRVMQDKLLRLKCSINNLRPMADTLPNVALETLGAKVIPHRSSETYQAPSHRFILGVRLWSPSANPMAVIQQGPILAGGCWPFAGDRGHLVIILPYDVNISHVTLGHISKTASPTGDICDAPKEFSVYGAKTKHGEAIKLGIFMYDQDGGSLQTFKLPHREDGPFRYMKLQVQNNWGDPEHTCLYNFRVHGKKAADR